MLGQEVEEDRTPHGRTILLHPMPGAIHEMAAAHVCHCVLLHRDHVSARALIDAPVALPRDEARRHVDGAAGEDLEVGGVASTRRASIPLQPPLKAVPAILLRVHGELT